MGLFGETQEYMDARIHGYKNVELGLFCKKKKPQISQITQIDKFRIGFVWFFLILTILLLSKVHSSEFIVKTINSVGNCFPRASFGPAYIYVSRDGKVANKIKYFVKLIRCK